MVSSLRLILSVLLVSALLCAAPHKTRHVILVTADGLRWQDLFNGIDPALMDRKETGMQEARGLRDRLWRSAPEERRKALMPWLWTTLVSGGTILGNVTKGSSVRVTNSYRVSYPGYSEILTGRAQDDAIRGNDPIQNPTPTVLQFVREKLNLAPSQVALFGSWDMFSFIGQSRPNAVFINAGYTELPPVLASARFRDLNGLQFRVLGPDATVRHDYVTFEMGLEYLKTARPLLMHIALGETDDWAHLKRYDRVLEMISEFDRCLGELWAYVQSQPDLKDSTTLVVATDHGRGGALKDWSDHGSDVPGADQIWIAFLGPDTPSSGELTNTPPVFQRDIAPTILELLGIDYREYQGVLGKPVAPVVR